MAVGNKRATIMGIKEEVTPGVLIRPSSATDYLPLRPGFGLEYTVEELTSDELQSDIGLSKSNKGKEGADGTHEAYLKHSGVEGVEPEMGIMYESFFGQKIINATEYTAAASSTTSIIKVADGTLFYKNQALLIKDGSNGYSIRNVKNISTNDLELNFNLPVAPANGVALGKAISYLPQPSGFKTFSTWMYEGNGFDIIAASNCQVTEISVEMAANQFGTVSVTYSGTKFYYNPILIGATNKFLDVTDDGGTFAVSVAEGWYRTSMELAAALQQALLDASLETYTVTYNNDTGHFIIASGSTVLSLLVFTGTNAANGIGATLGFTVGANKTGSVSYTSENAQSYAPPHTPSYDVADAIVIKGAEFMIGTPENTMCRCATTLSIKMAKTTEDADCICEETGTKEKVATSREITIEAELIVSKYDVSVFNYLLNNTTVGAMINAGPKTGGNWTPGKCANFYMANAVVTGFSPTGDQFVLAKISLRGFVNSVQKDGALNFV